MVRPAGRATEYDIFRAEREAPAVMAAVRAYDPQLLVGWDNSACRWSLLRVSRGGYHFVGIIERPDHQYRPLTMELVEDLARWDVRRRGKNPNEVADREECDRELRDRKTEHDFRGDVRHATADNRRTLHRLAKLVGL